LRPRLEGPPVEEVAIADRNGAFILLDAPLHFLEQLVDQHLVLSFPAFEIGILFLEVSDDVRVIDLGIFGVAQPVPRVLNGHVVTFIAEGTLLGFGGRWKAGSYTHPPFLTR